MISNISRKIFILSFVLSMFFVPLMGGLHAQAVTIVQNGITTDCVQDGPNGTKVYGNCGFNELLGGVKNVINWAVTFALSFSVIVLAYAGYLYMTSGDSPGNIKKAQDMFYSVAIGIGWVLGAWLVVNLIVNALVDPNQITNFLK